MNKIDVDKLTLFYDKLTKLTSDCEENWYLVKRIMSEMEMEEEFHNPQVYQELYDSIQKLEIMLETFQGLKQITKMMIDEYETTITRHKEHLALLSEYANSLKANYRVLSNENQPTIVPVSYTNTGAIQSIMRQMMGNLEVIKDE